MRGQNLPRAVRDDGARSEHAGDTGLIEVVVVLRGNHAADEDHNVFAPESLQFGDHVGDQRFVAAGEAGDTEHVDVVLGGHTGGLPGSLEERADIYIEAEIGEGGMMTLAPRSAVLPILATRIRGRRPSSAANSAFVRALNSGSPSLSEE